MSNSLSPSLPFLGVGG